MHLECLQQHSSKARNAHTTGGCAPQNMVGGSKIPMRPISRPPMAPALFVTELSHICHVSLIRYDADCCWALHCSSRWLYLMRTCFINVLPSWQGPHGLQGAPDSTGVLCSCRPTACDARFSALCSCMKNSAIAAPMSPPMPPAGVHVPSLVSESAGVAPRMHVE